MRFFGRGGNGREGVESISVAQLRKKLDRGDAVTILDVRQPVDEGPLAASIPGSIRILPADLPDRYPDLPRDTLLVPFCT